MKRFIVSIATSLVVLTCNGLPAQEMPKFPQPQKEHQWLQQFVGQWETDSKASMGPDQPAMQCQGSMTSRSIGGFWIVNEMKGEMMGTPILGIQTIGYDSAKKTYVGIWVDSVNDHMWRYEGTVDASGKKLTLEAEGPNFMADGKLTKFRDAYEFKSADHIVATSSMLGEDGQWVTFMTGDIRRQKVT